MTDATAAASPRAERFARRLRGERDLSFEERMRQLTATRHADENGERLALTLALLAARPALDRELSGARLQALATLVGDDLLDAVREADLDAFAPDIFDPVLPPPTALAHSGERLLAKASTSRAIAALAELAVALVRAAKVPA